MSEHVHTVYTNDTLKYIKITKLVFIVYHRISQLLSQGPNQDYFFCGYNIW